MGFKEKRSESTAVWNKLGEQKFRKTFAKSNTTVQEDQMCMQELGWTTNDLVEAGYADTVQGKVIRKTDYVFANEIAGRHTLRRKNA